MRRYADSGHFQERFTGATQIIPSFSWDIIIWYKASPCYAIFSNLNIRLQITKKHYLCHIIYNLEDILSSRKIFDFEHMNRKQRDNTFRIHQTLAIRRHILIDM